MIDLDLYGTISPERLNNAITRFINEHLLYNSNVKFINDDYYWIKRPKINANDDILVYIDNILSEQELFDFVKRPFNLESDNLSRYYLIKISETHFRFINVISHIILDGLSAETLYKSLADYYNESDFKAKYNLEEQSNRLIDLNNKLSTIQENHNVSMNDFWKKQLSNATGVDLQFLKNDAENKSCINRNIRLNPISEIYFSITGKEWDSIKDVSKQNKITPFILNQVVFAFLIHQYTGQDTVSFNFPVAIQEGQDIIYGAHVNTIIISFNFQEKTTLIDLINQAISFYKDLKLNKGKYLPIYDSIKYTDNKAALDIGFVQTDLGEYSINFNGIISTKTNRNLVTIQSLPSPSWQ